jgi:hypothetical protein
VVYKTGENQMAEGISVTLDSLRDKYSEIETIDQQLDAASGSESAGKRALVNALVAENENVWKKPADSLVNSLNKIEDVAIRTAAFHGVVKALNDSFKDQIEEFLAKEVEARKSDAVVVPPEEIETLSTSRKNLVEQYKALRNILEMFGQDVTTVPEPKKRTGARGKRGPRVLQGYNYSIDGKERSASQNSLSSIANTVCSDLGWKTVDLRNFLTEQGIDLTDPPETFSVTLPNNHVLAAVRGEEDEDEVVDEEETE